MKYWQLKKLYNIFDKQNRSEKGEIKKFSSKILSTSFRKKIPGEICWSEWLWCWDKSLIIIF